MRRIAVYLVLATAAVSLILAGGVLSRSPELAESPAERLALRLDAILDSIPERKIEADPILLTYEIVPYFAYEGLTSNPQYPSEIAFQVFGTGEANFHVLGRAGCTKKSGGPAYINARGANPVSPRYGEPWILPTIVHELIHLQGGGFCNGSSEALESTTQMATLEVLAAMANHGNKDAIYALLDEMRDMALGVAYYEALRDGELDHFFALRDRIYSRPLEQARSEKSRRFWFQDKQHEVDLKDVLNKYSRIPMERVLDGLADECVCIEGLYLGEWVDYSRASYEAIVNRYEARPLDLDDLAYFLAHAEALAEELSVVGS